MENHSNGGASARGQHTTCGDNLDIARRRSAIRFGSLYKTHPIVQRIERYRPLRNRGNSYRPTILTSTATLAEGFARPILHIPTLDSGPPLRFDNKELAAQRFRTWAQSIPPNHIAVYTDGSRLSPKGAPHISLGVGYVYSIYRYQKLVQAGCRPLYKAEVFDAEAEGAAAGLAKAAELFPQDPITVCLDNSAVLYGLQGNPYPLIPKRIPGILCHR